MGFLSFFFCVCISLLLWSNQPLLLWPLLCNWSRVICFNASTARTCIYLQIKRNIYRICQHTCSVCFVCLCCLLSWLWSGTVDSRSRTCLRWKGMCLKDQPFPSLFLRLLEVLVAMEHSNAWQRDHNNNKRKPIQTLHVNSDWRTGCHKAKQWHVLKVWPSHSAKDRLHVHYLSVRGSAEFLPCTVFLTPRWA